MVLIQFNSNTINAIFSVHTPVEDMNLLFSPALQIVKYPKIPWQIATEFREIFPTEFRWTVDTLIKVYFRYSKIEPLLIAHNWHWVSSMGTNVKINIFETHPLTSENWKNYSQHSFKLDGIYKYYYLFLF